MSVSDDGDALRVNCVTFKNCLVVVVGRSNQYSVKDCHFDQGALEVLRGLSDEQISRFDALVYAFQSDLPGEIEAKLAGVCDAIDQWRDEEDDAA